MATAGRERRVDGVPAAPGVARGAWCHVTRTPIPTGTRLPEEPGALEAARARIEAAANGAADELLALGERVAEAGHEDEAAIFSATAAMAWDPVLLDESAGEMREHGVGPVDAVLAAGGRIADRLAALDDELIAARAGDVRDVADRIARHLAGLPTDEATIAVPAIVAAPDLAPSLTATLPRDRLLGIVLEGGSPTSHAAILARAYGIPAVVGARGVLDALQAAGPAADVAIDGTSGEVVVAPDPPTVADWDGRAVLASRARARDLADASLPAVTLDGVTVQLLANIGSPAEAVPARALGARGVGLFRTEFLFLERATPPSEDEQAAAYRAVVEAFEGDPVTIRLLDVGGDKPIPYLHLPAEENPFLGVRALRLATQRPELFVSQLRACYRAAAAGPVKVMAPMVADATDANLLLELARQARAGLDADGVPRGEAELGVMLEIPSAILAADAYFGSIRFASLGTNDLTQYALAVDRGNPSLERYRDALHPAVLRLVAMAAEAADRAGIPLSVCGELGGDPAGALALVGLGVRQLSMGASSLPGVRRAIRAVEAAALRSAASDALGDPSAPVVRARFEPLLPAGVE
jgi:phosphoenolpyruvate-protein phosphotransferase